MEASEFRRIARENLAGNWGNAVLAGFLAVLLGGLIVGGIGFELELDAEHMHRMPDIVKTYFLYAAGIGSSLNFVHLILGGVIRQGYAVYLLKQYDRQDPQTNDLFSQFDHFGAAFCLKLLEGLFLALWSLLFIIPGIIKAYSYAMAPFIMAENPNMTAREALTASTELMDGHKAELFFLNFSFLGWALLSVLTLGIGNLWLNPYQNAAYAAFYRNISHVTVK